MIENISFLGQKTDLLDLQHYKDIVSIEEKVCNGFWFRNSDTDTMCLQCYTGTKPHLSNGTCRTRRTNATMKFMPPAVLLVIKFFISDPVVVCLLSAFMKI